MSTFYARYIGASNSSGVTSVNGLSGALTLAGGPGVTITPSGSTITISATGTGANTALSNLTSTSINQSLVPNANNTFGLGTSALAWNTVWAETFAIRAPSTGSVQMVAPATVATYVLTWPATQGGVSTFLQNDGSGGLSWASGTGGSGVNAIGAIDSQAASPNGLVIVGTTLYAQSASATNPGLVNNTTQTLSGAKTFSTAPILSSLTASLPLQLDGSKNIISAAIDLSGAEATGILAAGRFPALTGDVTTTAGSLVTSLVATSNSTLTTLSALSLPASQLTGTGNLTDAGTDGIVITGGTGAVIGTGTSIAQHVADTTHNGYLSSADWNTFNSKQPALTLGNLTDVGTDGITITGGTGAVVGSGTTISQQVADTTHNGYLSSTDWNTFNGKQASGNYITALTGDATASGPGSAALTLATVNANTGSFGSSTAIPSFTVNGKGLITAASTNAVVAPAGTLSGTTLNSTVVSSSLTSVGTIGTGVWNGTTIAVANGGTGQTSYTDGQLLIGSTSGNTLAKASLTAGTGITITPGSGSITIASSGSGGSSLNFTAQNTAYNAVVNDYVQCSGSNFNVTLPTAIGQAGKVIAIQHNGTSITNTYGLNTTGGQTVGGITSGNYVLATNGEFLSLISDGANWQIQDHKTNTALSSSSPTVIGAITTPPTKGTTSVDSMRWKREGQYAWCYYEYNQTAAGSGAAGSGNYLFSLPASLVMDTTLITINTNASSVTINSTNIGTFTGEAAGASQGSGVVAIPYSSTQFRIAGIFGGASNIVGSSLWNLNAATVMFGGWVKVPITGWQP